MKKIMVFSLISTSFLLGGCGQNTEVDGLNEVNASAEEVVESSEREEFDINSYYTNTDFLDFYRNPDELKGTKTSFVAKVFQVIDDDDLVQYMATVTPAPNDRRTIKLGKYKDELETRIIDGDEIRVWVRSLGEISYTTNNGGTNTVPGFYIDAYQIIED
ncbi:hypothetical protein FQS90_12250 [Enterococcus casseliflavus]|uniref:hypothetical protein n=1 Tax=Enterococcus sp. 8E11_MSG4843 TaxID=1834190 RepID=UPI000B3ED8B5|nr:hypothetical protein [Enterococcus sp. 8E11_MSG4843]MBO1097291.1 hypothetical protein [Enterococcus casseliflavus]MBO1144416.1 hypothetical protein [Enterococcus casseliflavus]OUZ36109.1 hypothetical protein A5885_000294 [Enterococcus sp. 8E11_MSG4843]